MADEPEIRIVTIDGYPIDVVRMERHEFEAEATSDPVEDGANITDHISLNPTQITLECLVSNTPIGTIAEDPSRQLQLIELEEDLIEIEGETNEVVVPLPADDCYQRLKRILRARQPVTIETSLERFDNMVLLALSIPVDSKTSGGLTFEAKFREIEIVEVRRTTVVAVPIGSGKEDFGLSLDKVIEGRHILWRKGKPPGRSPSTDPKGEIVGQEVVYQKSGKFYHEDQKTQLSTQENLDFAADLRRDTTLMQLRAFERLDNAIDKSKERQARWQKMIDFQRDNPGKTVDPALFGLPPDYATKNEVAEAIAQKGK